MMNQNKNKLTRVVSFVLSVLMMVSCMSAVQVTAITPEQSVAVIDDGKWSGTTSGLVASNYALNDAEKAVLNSAGLAGDIYSIAIPDESNGLVSVDADNQVITAKAYETDGFVWVPTLAVVVYSANGAGDAIDVELNKVGENYVGNFTKPANSYSVKVVYTLNIAVDSDLQKTLINTPFYLADGYLKLKDAVDGSLAIAVSAINEKMPELRALYEGITYEAKYEGQVVYSYKLGFEDGSNCKAAIGNLIADFDKPENNSRLTLAKDFDDYRAAQSKIKFMLENGETIKEHINWFYTQLANINAHSSEILAIADKLENLVNGTGEGTIADAKNKIDELVAEKKVEAEALLEEKIQTEIIKVVVDKAKNEYGLDISSLSGKTRKDNAIYNEIEAKRTYFKNEADSLESKALFLDQIGNTSMAQQLRESAALLRSEEENGGIGALNKLEDGIREAYRLGDEAIADKLAEVEAKKADLDAMGTTALEKAADIREIVSGANGGIKLSQVVNTVKNYRNQTWYYIGKKLVSDDITDEQYLALDSVVKASIDPILDDLLVFEHEDDIELKAELYATETEITSLVEQYSVHVDVKASVVSKNSVDSKDLISLDIESTEFPLDKNTSAADVVNHIDITNVEYTALDIWDSYYNINTDNYNRTVTVTDKDGHEISDFTALTTDIIYTIEYTPKNVTITEAYKDAGSNVTTVPYGYNWRLPRPAEVSKSYDYTVDGVSYLENTVIRVVKNIVADRKEGKALSSKSLAELIAMSKIPGLDLSDKERAILNSGAILSDTIYYRTPENKDALTTVEDTGAGYKVVAKTMVAGIVGSNAAWTPVNAVPVFANGNGAPVALTKNGDVYEGTFAYGAQLLNVQVTYQLSIDTVDVATVTKYVNVGSELVAAAGVQTSELNALCTQNNFYKNLEQVTSTVLGTVGSAVPDMSTEAKAALNELTTNAINGNTTYTYLYEYLTQYMSESGGLSYLYKGQNAANIIKQINLVNTNLPKVWNDAAVQAYINSMPALSSQSAKIEAVMAQLAATDVPAVNELVNTNSAFVDNLVAAINATGETSTHTGVSGVIVLEQTLSAAAPGQMVYAVEIEVLGKTGDVVNTFRTERFVPKNTVVAVAEFEAMYSETIAKVANSQYYVVNKDLPATDITVDSDKTFTSTLSPKQYTVKIDGEADQYVYAFDAYTITLPGTNQNGFKYIYNVAGKTQEVGTGALENYSLGTDVAAIDALFGADSELVITRTLVDINRDNFIKFISTLNKAFDNSGFDGAEFIPFEDNDGNLAIVLRVTTTDTTLDANKLASELVSVVQTLSYVGLNNSPLFGLNADNEVKLYVQSIINMIASSGLGLDTLVNITNEDGTLKEFKINNATVVDGFGGSNLDKLGAKIIDASMQYGVNINNATSAPLYVTYQDYGTQTENLKKTRLGAQQIMPYINLKCKDGAINMSLNLPDSVYAYLMSAMLITGQVDFETIQSYDVEEVLSYWLGLIKPMFAEGKVSADTLINTIEKTGLYGYIANFDTEANKAMVDTIYNIVENLFNNTGAEGSSVGGKYTGVLTYDALDYIFGKKPALSEYANMIAEKDTGLEFPVTCTIKNRDTEYQALVLDLNVEDTITNPKENLGGITAGKDAAVDFAKKYYMSRNIVADIAGLTKGAIVIMLSDVRGNITVNDDVIINLNGYTINGDITSKGVTTIVDSTLTTAKYGSVTGKLIENGGTFVLGSGKFASGAEKYIESCYYIENNIVTNGCYSIEKDGEDLNVYLGTEYMSLDKPALKVMATDLVFKLLMNYYEFAQLTVDGNTLYSLDARNVTAALDNMSSLIEQCVDSVDTQGCSNFATQFMKDVTNFAAIADAVDNKTALVEYSLTNHAFEPYMMVEGADKDSFLSFNVKANSNIKKVTNINVYVANEVDADKRAKISEVLRELDDISTIDNIKVEISSISYANRAFDVKGSATADVEVDLTNDVNYPVIIAAIIADGVGGSYRTELVDAIKAYQTSNATDTLKTALEKVTLAQVIVALKNTKNKSFENILSTLGLTAPDAKDLEAYYTIARKVAGIALDLAKINGNDAKLGSFKTSEYGVYDFNYERGADTELSLTLKLLTEAKDITVKDKNGIITMNTDNLAEALESVSAGSTVYVNGAVSLDADVTLPAVDFTVVGADKVTFGASKLWFTSGYTKLTVDKDITAYTASDSAVFCSQIKCEKVGENFVYTLLGEQHEWEDIAEVKPTCTEDGSTAGVWCKHCHQYQDGKQPTKIDRLGHDYDSVVVEPTCTTEGYTLHTCGNCGDTYKTDIVPAKNHAGTTKILDAKEPTCTEDGLTEGLMCTACNEIIVEQKPVPAAHKPVLAETEASCTDPGYSGRTVCSVCNEVIDEGTEIPAKGHKIEVIQGTAPTCTDTGLTAGAFCPVCNYVHVKQEIISALGHTEVIDKAVEATCKSTGLTEGKHCKVCDLVTVPQIVIPKTDHVAVVDHAVPATCTKTGLTEGSHCKHCGEVLVPQTETPKTQHKVVIDKAVEATCDNPGLTEGSHCAICDEVFVPQTTIPQKAHVPVKDAERKPTCTVSGLTEGSHCELCGKVLVPQQDVPVIDHTPVVDAAVSATKDKTGLTEGSHCKDCGKVLVAQTTTAKLPYINVPVANVTTDGKIRGAKVDVANKRIYLDVAPNGFTVEEFAEVNFVIENATTSTKTISKYDGSAQRGAKDLICTGDTVTVWAANADGVETSVKYSIIIMGDANCDGKLNARDLVLMKLSFVGDLALEAPGSLAADMNFDGKINARDTVACETKYLLWAEKQYVSLTK